MYGSLYPWRFAPAHLTANPLWILLHAWNPPAFRYLLRDSIVNVALYMPLGFIACFVWRKAVYAPVLLGLALSVLMELVQLWTPTRNTSMLDVVTNVAGAGLGTAAAMIFEAVAPRGKRYRGTAALRTAGGDRSAAALIFCWMLWIIFPVFPALSTHGVANKLAIFLDSPPLDPMPMLWAAAAWYAAGVLTLAAGWRIRRWWLIPTVLTIPVQFVIVDRQPLPASLLGALGGAALFAFVPRRTKRARTEAWLFLGAIVVHGLWPFQMVSGAAQFIWIPFGAMLGYDWQTAFGILIEKAFFYGAAVWLMRAAGMTMPRAVALVAAVLAAIETLQIHMPAHTAEITDPLLATLMGFALAMLSRPSSGVFRDAHADSLYNSSES